MYASTVRITIRAKDVDSLVKVGLFSKWVPSENDPEVMDLEVSEAIGGGWESLSKLAEMKVPFYGSHDDSAGYVGQAFASYGTGELFECAEVTHVGLVVGCDVDGGVRLGDSVEFAAYSRALNAAKEILAQEGVETNRGSVSVVFSGVALEPLASDDKPGLSGWRRRLLGTASLLGVPFNVDAIGVQWSGPDERWYATDDDLDGMLEEIRNFSGGEPSGVEIETPDGAFNYVVIVTPHEQ